MQTRGIVVVAGIVLGPWLGACDDEKPPPPPFGRFDAGPVCEEPWEPPPTTGDADGDGTPNDMDDDADGDGISNAYEHVGGQDCRGHDPDGDGTANWLDLDSDDDGLLDASERDAGTNAYRADSDGDGASDLVELRGAGTDPLDPEHGPHPGDAVVAMPEGATETVSVRFPNRIENADVFFLVDTTASMAGEINALKNNLVAAIIPALEREFQDLQLGVGGLDDYPVVPYGESDDRPFYLTSRMAPPDADEIGWSGSAIVEGGNGDPDALDGLEGLGLYNGADLPESFVPALYATATGRGLKWNGGEVPPQDACPSDTRGYPCFRRDALPIVVLVGDALTHNGPGDANAYASDEIIDPPSYDQAIAALRRLGARVVGIFSGPEEERGDFEAIATDTEAVRADGSPLVFQVESDGTGLDTTVVDAMVELADGVTQDITAYVGGAAGELDVTGWVQGFSAGEGAGYDSKDETTFFRVAPDGEVSFDVTLENADGAAMSEARVGRIDVRALGAAGAAFATRTIYVIVPPEGRDRVALE